MILASRGGRNSTSTELAGYWGVDSKQGGLHQPPFIFSRSPVIPKKTLSSSPFSSKVCRPFRASSAQKKERPVGAPAALAWGMEWHVSEGQFVSRSFRGVGPSTALASSRTTHRSKIVTIISPPPEANLTPDNKAIVPLGPLCVTSPRGSNQPVLRTGTLDRGPEYQLGPSAVTLGSYTQTERYDMLLRPCMI